MPNTYIRPFLYLSGSDDKNTIYEKIQKIKMMGADSCVIQYSGDENTYVNGVCLFDERYYELLGEVSCVCEEMKMTFWVQDAAPYPTGSANGFFANKKYASKARCFLDERHINIRGPVKDVVIPTEYITSVFRCSAKWNNSMIKNSEAGVIPKDRIYKIIAMRKSSNDKKLSFDFETAMDLTDRFHPESQTLEFDCPEGIYRIFFLTVTYTIDNEPYFMNIADKESIGVLLESIYIPHYEHLKDCLEKTWEGFFYDEPEFGNIRSYFSLPGKKEGTEPLLIPWCTELERDLCGQDILKLPALWYDCGEITEMTRYAYMDRITHLVEKNYGKQVWEWCHQRGIGYIGHVIEDEGAHTRLGHGAGHFFRAQKFQDEAGIDLITGQLIPDIDYIGNSWTAESDGDGEFFHYGLAKLAASEAHINPIKKGKSFCELGALYGAVADGKFYKYLADYMFVNGINKLIPAIPELLTTTEGKLLFDYCKKMCELLDEGQYETSVAMLYHAEDEWCGSTGPFYHTAGNLAKRQIEYDAIPGDALVDPFYGLRIKEGCFEINQHEYQVLLLPDMHYLRRDVKEVIDRMAENHITILATGQIPENYCETGNKIDWDRTEVKLIDQEEKLCEIKRMVHTERDCPELRVHYFQKENTKYCMLLNTSARKSISEKIVIAAKNDFKRWDMFTGEYRDIEYEKCTEGICFELSLLPYESILLKECTEEKDKKRNIMELTDWTVCLENSENKIVLNTLTDMGRKQYFPRYAGKFIYRTTIYIQDELPQVLDLGQVCDRAEVVINGKDLGMRIAAPYRFNLKDELQQGKNILEVTVKPNPGRALCQKDPFYMRGVETQAYMMMEPTGLLGPVLLELA